MEAGHKPSEQFTAVLEFSVPEPSTIPSARHSPRSVSALCFADFVWKVKVHNIKWFVLKEKLTQPDGEQIIQFKKINSVREKWQIYDSI